jgi:DNA-binding FadR family transcriptional regulator
VASQNLTDQFIHELGKKIVQGKIKPGEILPSVEMLSEENGISRTVVREALKGIAARMLVKSVPKMGTIVRPRSDWQWWHPDILSWASEAKPNQEFLKQLTEIRVALEPAVTKLAAKNATEADIEKMKACYHKLEKSIDDVDAWAHADYNFHNSILLASRNELLINFGNLLYRALLESRKATIVAVKNNRVITTNQAIAKHKEILEAICSHDEIAAEQKMYDLLLHVTDIVENLDDTP